MDPPAGPPGPPKCIEPSGPLSTVLPMSRGPRLRRWLPWLAGLGSIFLLAAAAWALTVRDRNISNPDVEFTAQPDRPPVPAPRRSGSREPSFEWPVYGYTKQRTRELTLRDPSALHP